jgi:hypothetical protein
MLRLERVRRSAISTMCQYCDEVMFRNEKEVTEMDYNYVHALYTYIKTKAQTVGGVKAVEQIIDDIYHIIRDVAPSADKRTAVEEFFASDDLRTEDHWPKWQAVAAYLCNILEKDCREEYVVGGERR